MAEPFLDGVDVGSEVDEVGGEEVPPEFVRSNPLDARRLVGPVERPPLGGFRPPPGLAGHAWVRKQRLASPPFLDPTQDGFHLSVVDPSAAQPQRSDARIPRKQLRARSLFQSRDRQARYLTRPSALMSGLLGIVAPKAAQAHDGIAHQQMLHSARFVLVDREARLRGYYQSDEKAALRRLRRDVRTVLREH